MDMMDMLVDGKEMASCPIPAESGRPFTLLVEPEVACGAARRLESKPLSRRQYHLGDTASYRRNPELEKFDRAMDEEMEDVGSPNVYVGTALYWRP
jgi:hypothetical protein